MLGVIEQLILAEELEFDPLSYHYRDPSGAYLSAPAILRLLTRPVEIWGAISGSEMLALVDPIELMALDSTQRGIVFSLASLDELDFGRVAIRQLLLGSLGIDSGSWRAISLAATSERTRADYLFTGDLYLEDVEKALERLSEPDPAVDPETPTTAAESGEGDG